MAAAGGAGADAGPFAPGGVTRMFFKARSRVSAFERHARAAQDAEDAAIFAENQHAPGSLARMLDPDYAPQKRAEAVAAHAKFQAAAKRTLGKKKGEGARGGTVVGHTKSGKAIYHGGLGLKEARARHDTHESLGQRARIAHPDFTAQDHREAAAFHHDRAHTNGSDEERWHAHAHESAAKLKTPHMVDTANEIGAAYGGRLDDPAGKRSRGQEVEAAAFDDRQGALFKALRAGRALVKAGATGEGSRGGRIIGRTKGGKPIYDNAGSRRANGIGARLQETAKRLQPKAPGPATTMARAQARGRVDRVGRGSAMAQAQARGRVDRVGQPERLPGASPAVDPAKAHRKALAANMEAPKPGELREAHHRYFNQPEGTQHVPMEKLRPVHERPEGVANGEKYMKLAHDGHIPKRKPPSLKKHPDGTYSILDGNSTYHAAKRHGWKTLPGTIDEEGAMREGGELHKALLAGRAMVKGRRPYAGPQLTPFSPPEDHDAAEARTKRATAAEKEIEGGGVRRVRGLSPVAESLAAKHEKRARGGVEPTHEAAHAAGRDAGNRSMRAAGRTTWNDDDYNAAAGTYEKIRPAEPKAPAKKGEGSRGGVVTGHTQKGKPKYAHGQRVKVRDDAQAHGRHGPAPRSHADLRALDNAEDRQGGIGAETVPIPKGQTGTIRQVFGWQKDPNSHVGGRKPAEDLPSADSHSYSVDWDSGHSSVLHDEHLDPHDSQEPASEPKLKFGETSKQDAQGMYRQGQRTGLYKAALLAGQLLAKGRVNGYARGGTDRVTSQPGEAFAKAAQQNAAALVDLEMTAAYSAGKALLQVG